LQKSFNRVLAETYLTSERLEKICCSWTTGPYKEITLFNIQIKPKVRSDTFGQDSEFIATPSFDNACTLSLKMEKRHS